MSDDDDEDCGEHVWRLRGLTLSREEGSHLEYECERCDAVLLVPPGGVQPATA